MRLSRRRALTLSGAAVTAGLAGCSGSDDDAGGTTAGTTATTTRDLEPMDVPGEVKLGEDVEHLAVTSHGAYRNAEGTVVLRSVVTAEGGDSKNWIHWSYELYDENRMRVELNDQRFGVIEESESVTDVYPTNGDTDWFQRYRLVLTTGTRETDSG